MFQLSTQLLLLLHVLIPQTNAQGRMLDPPSRSSAWRVGFGLPVNYDDHLMNCGSAETQWNRNEGKCGICGESWTGQRLYERPNGPLVQHNVITRIYTEDSLINVTVESTVNRMGYFEFRICDVATSGGIEASQRCLDNTLLENLAGHTKFFFPTDRIGKFRISLILPKGMTCSHCVVQWKWRTGSNWGCDSSGCGLGQGNYQEEFYACADVTILPKDFSPVPTSSVPNTYTTSIHSTATKRNATCRWDQMWNSKHDTSHSNVTSVSTNSRENMVEFLKMILGLPNSFDNGYPIRPTTTSPTPANCSVSKDAVDRFCFACYDNCCLDLCFVLCPTICRLNTDR